MPSSNKLLIFLLYPKTLFQNVIKTSPITYQKPGKNRKRPVYLQEAASHIIYVQAI